MFLGTWYLNLGVLNSFLLYTFPLVGTLFIIIHQEILQRNFISIKKEAPLTKNSHEYLEELLRIALAILNKNKNFYCILEHQSDLRPLIKNDFFLKAELKQDCLSYITDSQSFDEHKFLWCSTQGYLVAVNSQWKMHQTTSLQEISYSQNEWKRKCYLDHLKNRRFCD